MVIDDKTVEKIAKLAKLEFDEAGKAQMKQDMNNMLQFFEKLDEVDTENVEPLIFMTEEVNVLRDDVAEQAYTQEQALKNAPKKDSDYFRIPKVLSK